MASIKHLFHIASPRTEVYNAVATINGLKKWWTVQTSGNDKSGGTITFRFGEAGMDFKVIALKQNELISWECVAGFDDWVGTTLTFALDENEGKTRVRFEHGNWKEAGDHYANCNFSWGRFLESLRQLCQTGEGKPFGAPQYAAATS